MHHHNNYHHNSLCRSSGSFSCASYKQLMLILGITNIVMLAVEKYYTPDHFNSEKWQRNAIAEMINI
jgi:hypothetical protein